MKQFWEMFRVRAELLDRIREIAKRDAKDLKLRQPNMQDALKKVLDHYDATHG